jgi:serine/threonine protein kinase
VPAPDPLPAVQTARATCVRCGVLRYRGGSGDDGFCACGGWLGPPRNDLPVFSNLPASGVRRAVTRELVMQEIRNRTLTDRIHVFRQDHVNVGRAVDDHLVVHAKDPDNRNLLSARHLSIMNSGNGWIVRNNSRARPIFVDGSPLLPVSAARPESEIQVSLPVEIDFDPDLIFALWVYDRAVPTRILAETTEVRTQNGWRLRYLTVGGGSLGTQYVAEFTRQPVDAADSAPTRLTIPAVLGDRYEVDDVLSNGGFGTIYTATDHHLGSRRVLVKAHRHDKTRQFFKSREDVTRIETIRQIRRSTEAEAESLLRVERLGVGRVPLLRDVVRAFVPELHGPHSTPGADGKPWFWEDRDYVLTEPYLIMQWIEGETLDRHIARQADRNSQEWRRKALRITLELCDILGALHNGRDREQDGYYFIYQDLKPANVIVTDDEFLTLLDFGGMLCVARLDDGRWDSCVEDGGEPGLGTAGYKPPEMNPMRFRESDLDDGVDLYTIGATLFYMLTGQDPNRVCGEYGPIPAAKLVRGFVPPEWGLTSPPPGEIVRFLRRALAESRDERFKSAEEMKKACSELFVVA